MLKMLKTRFVIFTFILLSIISKAQEIGFPIIRNYTPEEYNGAPQIFSVIQDNRGIMYFGSGGMVLEYDGVTWRSLTNKKQTTFLDFAKDKNGRVYVTAMDEFGYLKIDNKGSTIYQSLTKCISDSTYKIGFVWSVKITSKYVYFVTYDAILQYSSDVEKLNILKADSNDLFLDGFIYKDILYIQCSKSGLKKIEQNKVIPALQSDFFKEKNIFRTALSFNTNTLLIPTRTEGLYLYQPEKDTIPQTFTISKPEFLHNNNIYNASLFQKEYTVLGSVNKGALLIDRYGKVLQHYNENNLLQNNAIRVIMADTSQNLWLGLDNGISKTEYRLDLSYWNKNAGLKGSVYDVIRFKGTVYIATSIKLYFIDKNNQVQEVKNIPVGHNWCFLENKNINSLLAGSRYGVYEIIGDSAILICKTSHSAKMIQSTKNPNRVFSSVLPDFMSIRYEEGKWIFEGNWVGIKDQIRGVIEDENGDLWLGTYRNGVIRVTPNYDNITQPKKIRYYSMKDGFTTLSDILPFKYKNKIIWGTEKGIYFYNPQTDRFEPYCGLGNMFCDGSRSIYSLKEMPDGKIWICPKENKKADIGYLQPNNNGSFDWEFAPFRRIPEMHIESFYVEPTGIVWIGGSEGLYRYDMTKDNKNYKQSFNCLIRKVTVGRDSILYGGNIFDVSQSGFQKPTELKYEMNNLKFEFAAPFFDQEDKTLYSYKLEGNDKEWSKWSREYKKEYTNLHKGKYIFKVKARNVYDVESESSSYSFTILPPFYLAWYAYCFYFILFALLIFIVVKLYTRFLRKQKDYLKKIVRDRTHEIQEKNEELQQQKEEIQTQANLLEYLNYELEQLSIVASKADNSVIIADKFGDIFWVNNGFFKVFGYTKEEYIEIYGKNIIQNKFNEQQFQFGIQQHSSVSFETLDETKNGNKIWIQSTVTPIFDENENLQKIIIINSDVTRIKIAEEEIKQQREEILAQRNELEHINKTLEIRVQEELKKNREKEIMMVQQSRQATMGEMIGNIAHQWRQPLNAVGLLVQNIKESFDYGELSEEYLSEKTKKVMQIIMFMSQTIEDFRNFFRTDKEKKMFSVKETCIRTLSFVEGAFKNNNIKVILEIQDGVEINGFPNEFAQVLLNILNNAKDAFIENNIAERTLIIKSFILEDKVVVTIADNAGGIPEHIINQIFDPYFTTKDSKNGTGLGLYMSKTIIEKNMEGALNVQNINNGAEFTIIV